MASYQDIVALANPFNRHLALFSVLWLLSSVVGCDYQTRRWDVSSTLSGWIGNSETIQRNDMAFGERPAEYVTLGRDSIDGESPLFKALNPPIDEISGFDVGYSIEVDGETFERVTANDERIVFRRKSGEMSVLILLKPSKEPDLLEVVVLPTSGVS